MNMDPLAIIDKYYSGNEPLRHILLVHSRKVAEKALALCDMHPELSLDREFIYEASMLHDIGIIFCDAEGIHCHGDQPYICHGILGSELLRKEGLERHALVCERHTGAGITMDDITSRSLPLPLRDMRPQSMEEKIICFADKFFSKTRLEQEKTLEQARHSLLKFGEDGLERFDAMTELFLGKS